MADDDPTSTEAAEGRRAPGEGDVVVPLRLYKTVTVMATLIAILSVLLGFMFLDAATVQTGPLLWVLDAVTGAIGVSYDPGALTIPFGLAGLGLIVLGAAVYAFSTRFRTEGMGKSKDDTDEESNNG